MFDTHINRRGSSCYKWDLEGRLTGREGLLPFWIADMDFRAPEPVISALRRRLDHGVFGYTSRPDSVTAALRDWFSRRHGWTINPDWAVEIPSIVPFLHIFVQRFTQAGESVVIQEPVYYPFRLALERNNRLVAENPLIRDDKGCWCMDLDGLRRTLKQTGAKTLIFCSPHNPVGRVWSVKELEDLADLCREAGVTVVSDEIHADLIQPGNRHLPWMSLQEKRLPRSMALVSPTKSFNIPGLNTAWAVISDDDLRRETTTMLESLGLSGGSSAPFSYAAAEAAWREGEEWLDQLITYVGGNDQILRECLGENLPCAEISVLEGTYLAWIDLRRLNLSDDEIWERLLDAGIWLSRGIQFGKGGEGHVRMNLACPRDVLEKGLNLMTRALSA